MSNNDIIRAWKDEEYRNSLSEEQRSQLPEKPSGDIELSDEELKSLSGGLYAREAGTTTGSVHNSGCSCSCVACG